MARWRKKPVEIDAIQFTGDNSPEVRKWIVERGGSEDFFLDVPIDNKIEGYDYQLASIYDYLHDTEVGVYKNNYIIFGLKNEFYPCEEEVFLESYDPVEEDEDSIGPLTDYAHKIIDDLKNQNSLIDSRLFKDWGPLESTEIPTFKEIEDEDGRG